MANRLQSDNAKGQATWADIDDDDEDWAAPEAITWTDGTKTTIPHVDETANTPEQSFAKEVKPAEKPRSPAPPPATSGSPAVKPGGLASGKGLVLKSGASSEKPTLVAKPPAPPTPAKSPWAALPPMPKVSPMDVPEQPVRGFPPPSQSYPPRIAMAPGAREIAPDDFSRSPRRDNQQLFNSQSGRYEPVADRRGMARVEYHPRQPAVLQRPMHSESQGPAEPSAAFQTTHTSGGYGRRRGSSNVSGGSGSFARPNRPFDQPMGPPDAFNTRRPSSNSVGDHPMSPETFSPSVPAGNAGPLAHGGPGPTRPPGASPWQTRASPATSTIAPQIPGANEVQQQPPPPAPAGPTIDSANETVEYQKRLMKERREAAVRRRQELEAKEEAEKRERLAKKLEALGPPPERKSTKKDTDNEASPSPATTQPKETPENTASASAATTKPAPEVVPAAKESRPSALSNGVPPASQSQHQAPAEVEPVPTGENRHGHPWQPRVPDQPERIWGAGSQISRNVWGSPSDRSLGNGTFNSVPDTQPSQIASIPGGRPAPGPIGPPRATGPAGPAGTSSRLGPIGPPQRNGPRPAADDEREKRRSRWAQVVQETDEEVRVEQRARILEQEREMQARGLSYSDLSMPIQDQWTETNEDGHAVRRESTTYATSANKANPWPVSSGGRRDDRQRVVSSQSGGQQHGPAGTVSQQSRFFPPSRDAHQPLGSDTGRPKSPSPPPPEEDGIHPAFDGDALHPHVSLPKTKPIVKLPPAPASASSTSQRPTSTWGQPSSVRDSGVTHAHPQRPQFGASNTFSQGTNAQIVDRIKNLFADKPSSVNSSSRTAMPQSTYSTSATVSLPGIYAPSTIVDDSSLVTKTMDEDCFEEQEMGSLPPVHLPTDVPEAIYEPAKFPPKQDRRLLPVAPTTVESWVFLQEGRNVYILLPHNAQSRKTVVMTTRGSSNRGGRGSRGGLRYGSSYRGGNRGRDASASYSPEQTSTSSPAPGRSGRGHRGRTSDNWGRAGATPAIQTQ